MPAVEEPSAETLERVMRALAGVPGAAYCVPHEYPGAAPAFRPEPMAERPPLDGDRLRLYAHVPFCRYHCTFCCFAVRTGVADGTMARYVRALQRELEWIEPGTPLAQLFIGGGTPTALPPPLLDELLGAIFARTTRFGDGVHTVEASPETLTAAHIDVLRRHGIGRVSMGIQSLDDAVLEGVHRRHGAADALAACERLVDAGLITNTDLIYGLPRQTEASFLADMETVAATGVHSLTIYSLHLNDRTPVAKALHETERLALARLIRWRGAVKRKARELGFAQTRMHTFKRLDSIGARHERLEHFQPNGWGYQLGVGMSARSHLGGTAYRNASRLETYLERVESGRSPVEGALPLADEDRKTQFIGRSLGDGKPLSRALYARAFGQPIEDDFAPVLARLRDADLIVDDGEHLTMSELGTLVYDLVALCFYPPRAQDWLRARQSALVRPPIEPSAAAS
ncbi:coproporphyrinogen III oxidase family protein [bacterium]|nr:coproporphyrinogen III oxidase family protein [bacterium]